MKKIVLLSGFYLCCLTLLSANPDSLQTDSTGNKSEVKNQSTSPKKSYLWYYVGGVIAVGLLITYYENKKLKE